MSGGELVLIGVLVFLLVASVGASAASKRKKAKAEKKDDPAA